MLVARADLRLASARHPSSALPCALASVSNCAIVVAYLCTLPLN
jgi:hypothetical protein